jgi:hypothetical protein
VINLLIDREITSVITWLITSIFYAEIDGIINPQNKRITAFLFEFVRDGGIATPPLREF